MIIAALALFPVLAGAGFIGVGGLPARGPETILVRIFSEVRDFGPRPGEDFIKHEFFIGGPDDDDTNKDTSVVILIQNVDGVERMTVQVTFMTRDRTDPKIKTARETKSFAGSVRDGRWVLLRSDFPDRELEPLGAQILRAVLDKKRLMR